MFDDKDFDDKATHVSKKDKPLTLKDQIRKAAVKKINKDESASDRDSDEESADEKDAKAKRRANESNLFTKIGVPQKDEEAEIKRAFKKSADKVMDDSDSDDYLVKKTGGND